MNGVSFRIAGWGAALPATVLDNHALAGELGLDAVLSAGVSRSVLLVCSDTTSSWGSARV
jgi:3-oxoacyl-[acyl-carrier-protein] synthase III